MGSIVTKVKKLATTTTVLSWDLVLVLINLLTPNHKPGWVVPKGHAGFHGEWPDFVAPKPGDSRSCCPALNAMANHGILPHDGRNISFRELNTLVRKTYNFSPSFCFFVPNHAAELLNKSYWKDKFDLEELNLHNGIEHDASLTREDVHFEPDQSVIDVPLTKALLASATGKDKDGNRLLTFDDLVKFSGRRRTDARAKNPKFSLALQHKMFGSSNSSTLITIFGGKIKDLEILLLEERLPEGFESCIRERMGLTMLSFNKTAISMELKTKEGEQLPLR